MRSQAQILTLGRRSHAVRALVCGESADFDSELTPRGNVIERTAQPPVVIILNGDEPERLQHAFGNAPHRAQDFGHSMNRAGLCLEGDFNEVSLPERLSQTKQPAGSGDGLELSFRAAAVFQSNCSQHRISELNSCCAPRRMGLGEVRHR